MRSSLACLVAVLASGGCDRVFGLSGGELAPCGDQSFEGAKATTIGPGDSFSVSWDRDRIVYSPNDGIAYEQALPDGAPHQIDLGPYPADVIALAPEGDAVFVTAILETPTLQASVRVDGSWTEDPIVPVGTFAGTPTAAELGPRRVLVKLRITEAAVQEYEDQDGHWQPVGVPHDVPSTFAPNLTPAGFDMVYSDGSANAVVIAHRSSLDEWFGNPVVLLYGAHRFPQVLDRCHQLFVSETNALGRAEVQRYDR
jgi:hypothetical protein